MDHKIKVRLTVDLSKYISGLVAGTEGVTIGSYGMWSRSFDRFVGVYFPGKGKIDVLWNSLEIIDNEFLKKAKKEEDQYLHELKSASNIVKTVGPRGGSRYLSYTYTDSAGNKHNASNGIKKEAESLIEIFESNGLKVSIETID